VKVHACLRIEVWNAVIRDPCSIGRLNSERTLRSEPRYRLPAPRSAKGWWL